MDELEKSYHSITAEFLEKFLHAHHTGQLKSKIPSFSQFSLTATATETVTLISQACLAAKARSLDESQNAYSIKLALGAFEIGIETDTSTKKMRPLSLVN